MTQRRVCEGGSVAQVLLWSCLSSQVQSLCEKPLLQEVKVRVGCLVKQSPSPKFLSQVVVVARNGRQWCCPRQRCGVGVPSFDPQPLPQEVRERKSQAAVEIAV